MDRRDAVKRMAAAAGAASVVPLLTEILPAATPRSAFLSSIMAAAHGDSGWQAPDQQPYAPQFFGPEEYATVSTLTELIIPATDTPGAREAGVPQYLDTLLAETARWNASEQQPARVRQGLQWLSQHCLETHQQAEFSRLTPEQQTEMLRQMEALPEDDPGHQFFKMTKNATVYAYYTSKAGLVDEWHYQMDYRDSYPGCTHPEHQQ